MENWKEIPEIPKYEVSDLGNVRRSFIKGKRIICQCLDQRGYKVVNITLNGHSRHYTVHRLVAKAFIPNPENLETVDHKDEDKLNNSASNLRWMERAENWRRSNSKLTKADADVIRLLAVDMNKSQIARKYKVHKSTICALLARKSVYVR